MSISGFSTKWTFSHTYESARITLMCEYYDGIMQLFMRRVFLGCHMLVFSFEVLGMDRSTLIPEMYGKQPSTCQPGYQLITRRTHFCMCTNMLIAKRMLISNG